MSYGQAIGWLLAMDAEYGARFDLEDVLDEQKYEERSQAREFYCFCEREGYDPRALVLSVMPSFQKRVAESAD